MRELKGRGIIPGRVTGRALVTTQPLNFTAGMSKPLNALNRLAGVYYDRHHELHKQDLFDRVLVFPQAIGSTFTGMVVLETIRRGRAPKALVVAQADTLLTAGVILAEVWLEKKVPLLEITDPRLFQWLKTGQMIEVDSEQGVLRIIE
jgi:cis-L-3-hydroxyproline dehydratase